MKLLLPLAALATACSASTAVPPLAWQGAAPHLVARGQVDGDPVAIDLEGAAAADTSVLRCRRSYQAPLEGNTADWTHGELFALEIDAAIDTRVLRLAVTPQGFPVNATGTTWTLVPPDRQALHAGQARFEWAWLEMPDYDASYEATAEGGQLDVELFTGTPDDTGVVVPPNDGALGLALVAHWSTADEVSISLTAPCTTNDIELVRRGP